MRLKLEISSVLLLLVGLLTACAPNIYSLEKAAPSENIYAQALQREYLAMSKRLSKEDMAIASDKLVTRGLQASQGKIPPLQEISAALNTADKASVYSEIFDARQRLLNLLQNNKLSPEVRAKSQVYFECWLVLPPRSNDQCRSDFYKSLDILQGHAIAEQSKGLYTDTEEKKSDKNKLQGALPQVFLIYFPKNSLEITSQFSHDQLIKAMDVIEETKGRISIQVIGHADPREKNPEQLSLDRALKVEEKLREAVLPLSRIDIQGYGTEQPLVYQPADAPASELNQRVIIILS